MPDQTPAVPVEVTLKACPFCGGEAEYIGLYDADGVRPNSYLPHVRCQSCGAAVYAKNTGGAPRKQAIAAWNTRHSPSPPSVPRVSEAMVEAGAAAIRTWKSGAANLAGYRICGVVRDGDRTSYPSKMFETAQEAHAALDRLNAEAVITAALTAVPAGDAGEDAK